MLQASCCLLRVKTLQHETGIADKKRMFFQKTAENNFVKLLNVYQKTRLGAIIVFLLERRNFLPDQEIKYSQGFFIGLFRKAKIKGLCGGVQSHAVRTSPEA